MALLYGASMTVGAKLVTATHGVPSLSSCDTEIIENRGMEAMRARLHYPNPKCDHQYYADVCATRARSVIAAGELHFEIQGLPNYT